jgi:hypothetical protein
MDTISDAAVVPVAPRAASLETDFGATFHTIRVVFLAVAP